MLRDFFHYQAMFQTYLGLRMYVAYVFAAFASFAEGIGILMLLPLLQQADIGIEQSPVLNEGFGFIEQVVINTRGSRQGSLAAGLDEAHASRRCRSAGKIPHLNNQAALLFAQQQLTRWH